MIKTIEWIANAAVFGDSSGRQQQHPEFGEKNLIYGWNASGKTTLSRIFGLVESDTGAHLPKGARARLISDLGRIDTQSPTDRTKLHVRVFNRDFIEDNLSDHTRAPALLIVGSGNIRLNNRIAELGRRRDRATTAYRSAKSLHDDANKARDRTATNLAATAATALGVRNFRSPDLKAACERVRAKAKAHLLDHEALAAAIDTARGRDDFPTKGSLRLGAVESLPQASHFDGLLRETPKQQALGRLAENPALTAWVQSGLRFHEHTTQCQFCGGDASRALDEYANHFSDEYRKQQAALTNAIRRLEQPLPTPPLPHEKEWIPAVRDRLRAAECDWSAWHDRERSIRLAWLKQLQKKLENMDEVITPIAAPDREMEWTGITARLRALAAENDAACAALAATRQQAADQVKTHFAARYLVDPESIEQADSLIKANAHLERVVRIGKRIGKALASAQAELQNNSVAAAEINVLLQKMLGGRVSVEEAADGHLRFVRAGEAASNLSDGERTAVSLSYFLVSLRQKGQPLTGTIVFIDDPICSLDSNHIYDVAYLLLSHLGECRQLFISTHNSEFFNTVKQEWMNGRRFKAGHHGYLVHRSSETKSDLIALPGHLIKFRSDYHHVFFCLLQIKGNDSTDVDQFLHCPNLLRRFLEMYLGFRVPSAGSYQDKLHHLLDDEDARKAVAKFADEGSHSQSTLRLLQYSDFPSMARAMTSRVFAALESKDADHYAALIDATA